jgi:hypothetical protein
VLQVIFFFSTVIRIHHDWLSAQLYRNFVQHSGCSVSHAAVLETCGTNERKSLPWHCTRSSCMFSRWYERTTSSLPCSAIMSPNHRADRTILSLYLRPAPSKGCFLGCRPGTHCQSPNHLPASAPLESGRSLTPSVGAATAAMMCHI